MSKLLVCAALAAAVLCVAGERVVAGEKSACPVECGKRARAALALAGTRCAPAAQCAPMPRAKADCPCGAACDCPAGNCPGGCPATAEAKAPDGAVYVRGADGVYRAAGAPSCPNGRCPAEAARPVRSGPFPRLTIPVK
jgi:hypothetical protein